MILINNDALYNTIPKYSSINNDALYDSIPKYASINNDALYVILNLHMYL